jgi:hypothetical protein
MGGQRHASAALPPGLTRYPLYSWPVWTGAENFAHTGIRSPARPTLTESLYRLSYPADGGRSDES